MYRGKILAAAAIATASLGAGAASAQGLVGSDFYLKGFGGWTIPQNQNFNITDKASGATARSGFDYNTGYTLGAAAGYAISPNMAFELEYTYRNASADLKNVGRQRQRDIECVHGQRHLHLRRHGTERGVQALPRRGPRRGGPPVQARPRLDRWMAAITSPIR